MPAKGSAATPHQQRVSRKSSGGGRHRAAPDRGERVKEATAAAAGAAPKGKTSKTGRAARGAATGAAVGAGLGSVVPGVGTAIGGAAGAAVGGVGGLAGAVREDKAARVDSAARSALVAEFLLCMVVVGLSPLTDKHRDEPAGAWMKRATALMGVFLVLGLIGSAGRGAARAATGFGGLLTLALLISERSMFTMIAAKFGGADNGAPVGTAFGVGAGDAVAGAAGLFSDPAPVERSSGAIAMRSMPR